MSTFSRYLLILSFYLTACASAPRDFHQSAPFPGLARIYFYRPHQFETMWGKYEISLQGKPVKILGDEGFFHIDLPPGKTEIRSKHVSDKQIVALDLNLQENHRYYVKLDPESEKFTLLGAVGDILAISTMVAGAKSQMRLENGQGNLGDVANLIQGESAKESLKPKRAFGHHVLLSMTEAAALNEMKECCSSEEVDEVD